MNSTRRLGFLLGAGFSIPVGMPDTQTITDIALFGEDKAPGQQVYRHSDSTYYLGQPQHQDEYVPRIRSLLQILKGEIDRYYDKSNHTTTYEDLYYLASQIHDSEYWVYDNPAVQPLIDKLRPVVQLLLVPSRNESKQEWTLRDLASEAMHYIRDIVWHKLVERPQALDALSFFGGAIQDRTQGIGIFTLNHDIVIDKYLRAKKIEYVDGFGDANNGVRYFSPLSYGVGSNRVEVFKLHGSIDWFRHNDGIGIPEDWDYWTTVDQIRNLQIREWRPAILVGTFNKILDYTEGIFTELQHQFRSQLKTIDRLIVCGYSFGDKAINARIVEWMYSDPSNKMLVIDPASEMIKNYARGPIWINWDAWNEANRVSIFAQKIQETSWDQVDGWLSR